MTTGLFDERELDGRTLIRNTSRGHWLGAGRLDWDIVLPIGLIACGQ
jgi:hypothetical protein